MFFCKTKFSTLFYIRDPATLDQDITVIDKKDLPKCKKCHELLRPYIVWFGENLDSKVLQRASTESNSNLSIVKYYIISFSEDLIETCDLCLVIGTSSVVYPAAMFAPLVAEKGKPVAEFNLNEDPASDQFTFHFSGQCGSTLPKALTR